jgi:hypothetical protein
MIYSLNPPHLAAVQDQNLILRHVEHGHEPGVDIEQSAARHAGDAAMCDGHRVPRDGGEPARGADHEILITFPAARAPASKRTTNAELKTLQPENATNSGKKCQPDNYATIPRRGGGLANT